MITPMTDEMTGEPAAGGNGARAALVAVVLSAVAIILIVTALATEGSIDRSFWLLAGAFAGIPGASVVVAIAIWRGLRARRRWAAFVALARAIVAPPLMAGAGFTALMALLFWTDSYLRNSHWLLALSVAACGLLAVAEVLFIVIAVLALRARKDARSAG
jgi:hypothetical protein